jgi:hypothetical protein
MRVQPEYYATLACAARIRSTATVMTTLSGALVHGTRRSNLLPGCIAAADIARRCLLVRGDHSQGQALAWDWARTRAVAFNFVAAF